ncbi:MAG: ATP-binding protein [Armatimonadetes bacterium]|nr:ATP-binding protein [Armatimonadota bacterium]
MVSERALSVWNRSRGDIKERFTFADLKDIAGKAGLPIHELTHLQQRQLPAKGASKAQLLDAISELMLRESSKRQREVVLTFLNAWRDRRPADEQEIEMLSSLLGRDQSDDFRAAPVTAPALPSTGELVSGGASARVEFKQSLEYIDSAHGKYAKVPDDRKSQLIAEDRKGVVHSALKTIVAFLNSNGGALLIGVHDTDGPVGIEPDYTLCGNKQDWDGFQLNLTDLVKKRITPLFHDIDPQCVTIDGKTVCRIDVPAKPATHYLDGTVYIRFGNSTEAIEGQKLEGWLRDRRED